MQNPLQLIVYFRYVKLHLIKLPKAKCHIVNPAAPAAHLTILVIQPWVQLGFQQIYISTHCVFIDSDNTCHFQSCLSLPSRLCALAKLHNPILEVQLQNNFFKFNKFQKSSNSVQCQHLLIIRLWVWIYLHHAVFMKTQLFSSRFRCPIRT